MTARAESSCWEMRRFGFGAKDKGRMVNEPCSQWHGELLLLVSVPPVSIARNFLVLVCWRGLNP